MIDLALMRAPIEYDRKRDTHRKREREDAEAAEKRFAVNTNISNLAL